MEARASAAQAFRRSSRCRRTDSPLSREIAGDKKITHLVARFWQHAQSHYVKYGQPTGTHLNYRPVLRLLRAQCGDWLAKDFGPRALKALRDQLVEQGLSRRYINDNVDRIRSVFRFGVSEEIISATQLASLQSVSSVTAGQYESMERPPVTPVSKEQVAATLPHLPPMLRDMVVIQRLCGCRPGELLIVRPIDVEINGEVWRYRPRRHKTEHHGKQRIICLGPRAQQLLAPYLGGPPDAYCFSPRKVNKNDAIGCGANEKHP